LSFEFVVSQGRVADRSAGAIKGAELAAGAIQHKTGLIPLIVGTPSPPSCDDWTDSLPAARRTLDALQKATIAIFARGNRPLIVANTCSASLATLPVLAEHHPDAVVLWIDAHGDFNTPDTTASGYLGGMVLAAACGRWDSGLGKGIRPAQVLIAGARDIDTLEAEHLQEAGVQVLSPAQTQPQTIRQMIGKAPIWIHIDWDVLEPGFVPAAYAIADGLLPATLRDILQAIPRDQIVGVELTEFEASQDDSENASYLAHLLDIVSPLLPSTAIAA
jgi:arginase/N-omega-hydroxy-L-arginine amidinohydrolase